MNGRVQTLSSHDSGEIRMDVGVESMGRIVVTADKAEFGGMLNSSGLVTIGGTSRMVLRNATLKSGGDERMALSNNGTLSLEGM